MLLSTLLGQNSNSARGKTLLFKTSCFDCHEKAWMQHQRQQQQLCLLGLQLSLSSCTVASLYHLVWMKKDHMSTYGKTLLFKTSCFDCHEKAWMQHQRQQQQLCLLGLQLSLSSCTVASLYHLVWMKKDHMSMLQQWPVHLFGRNIILIKNYKTETAS